MNDTELDQLLDSWKAPVPEPSLREGLQARFPRPERRRLVTPRRLLLVAAAATVTMALGTEQRREDAWSGLIGLASRICDGIELAIEAWQAPRFAVRVRDSDPRVYVDGQLAPPLAYGGSGTFKIQVPGEGTFGLLVYGTLRNAPRGWVEAGRVHDNAIEFQADGKPVRILCNQPIISGERPVFVQRLQ